MPECPVMQECVPRYRPCAKRVRIAWQEDEQNDENQEHRCETCHPFRVVNWTKQIELAMFLDVRRLQIQDGEGAFVCACVPPGCRTLRYVFRGAL